MNQRVQAVVRENREVAGKEKETRCASAAPSLWRDTAAIWHLGAKHTRGSRLLCGYRSTVFRRRSCEANVVGV
jgi:hypothetical protein